jgi:hypothetical protein
LYEVISALRSGTLVQSARRTVASFLVEEWLSGGAASRAAELDVGPEGLDIVSR